MNCADLARSQPFYTEVLGLSVGVQTAPGSPQPAPAFGLDQARWQASILVGSAGFEGPAVDLLQWLVPTPTGRAPSSIDQPGFQRIGVHVPDLAAALDRVTSRGGTCWGEPLVHHHDGAEVHLAMVSDPDGVVIELVGGKGPRLSFVSVTCAALDRSVAFYEALGFRVVARFHSQGDDGVHLRLSGAYAMDEVMLAAPGGGHLTLLLVGFDPPTADPDPDHPAPRIDRPLNSLGIARLAALVPDLAAAHAELARIGLDPIGGPAPMTMGSGLPDLQVMCLRGPDGEVLELIESPQTEAV